MAKRRRSRATPTGSDLEQNVLEFLEVNPTRGFKLKELQRALGVPHSRYRSLRSLLVELIRAGRVVVLPRRRYACPAAVVHLEGDVEGVGQRATHVRLGDGTRLALVPTAQDRVVPGDRIRVRRVRDGREILAAADKVLSAAPRHVFGKLLRAGSRWVLVPELPIPGLSGGVFIAGSTPLDEEDDGSLAQGWLPAFDPASQRPMVESLEILGAHDHPQAAISLRIARAGWPRQFSDAALEIAKTDAPAWKKRADLCDEFVFTIDPIDAKDHDDAVSVHRNQDGSFVLGVHIADVAVRVPMDTVLDEEARARATSVYPPGRVIPMLPEILSAGACSLHHGVERDAVSVELRYDAKGRRRGVGLGLTRIRSVASLAYEHAEALLDGEAIEIPAERMADGVDQARIGEAVSEMYELATALRGHRRELGSLFVQRPEREFRFDESGHVAEVHLRPQLRAHWIIEEFMLEANRAVAEILQRAELPLLWRIHEQPDEQKVDNLVELLRQFDVIWTPPEPVSGSDYADFFAMIEGRPEAPLLHLLALRSLMKARYHAGWEGHFGLAFERYTHFTSPIRRYPDLHNQRWLHRLVDTAGQDGWIEDAFDVASSMAVARIAGPRQKGALESLADHCSEREREATRIERTASDICAADALKAREGQRLSGIIVSVLRSGIFVDLEDTGLDGFVSIEQLGREWFHHDPRSHVLRGERSGKTIRLGQRVSVLLEYVDVAAGRTWLGEMRLEERPGGDRDDDRPTSARKRGS